MRNKNNTKSLLISVMLAFLLVIPGISLGEKENTAPLTNSMEIEESAAYAQTPLPAADTVGKNEVNTVILQPNATAGKDTTITTQYPDGNYGSRYDMLVGNGSYDFRALLQFDIDISASVKLSSATLSLYAYNKVGSDLNISVSPVIGIWNEGNWNGNVGAANWSYRTDTTPWHSPGGDFDSTEISYIEGITANTWYSWNVTSIVRSWMDNATENNGFILYSDNPNSAQFNYINFYSSDYADPLLRPKLTITYSAQIDPQVPPITTDEDTPVDVELSGRAHGTVEHISVPQDASNLWPFYTSRPAGRYQAMYLPEEVGTEGKIMRIALNRTAMDTNNVSNLRIYMAHTDLTNLTTNFDSNYDGFLIEVFKQDEWILNSSDSDSWLYFDLNGNFTYDSAHNLLVEIRWNGTGGSNVPTWCTTGVTSNRRAYAFDDQATTALSVDGSIAVIKFYTDAQKIGGVYSGTSSNYWPFAPNDESSIHQQMLWKKAQIGGAGKITKFYMQAASISGWAVVENLSIRMAHSTNSTLGAVFEANHIDPWVEVINASSYNVSTKGAPEWIEFDLQRPFDYNGNDNLVVDVRWRGGQGTRVYLAMNYSASYEGQLGAADYSATTGGTFGNRVYNVIFEFADSPVFSWSATSSNTSLFTVSISNNTLHINPVENMYGSGTVELTLHQGAYSTTQSIPVTINSVNDPPVISGLPQNLACTEDIPYMIDMANYTTDVEDDIANITFTISSSYATVNGSVITFTYPEGVAGEENITITATDSGGLSTTATTNTTVTLVNDPPYFENFIDNITVDATVPYEYILSPQDEETPDNLTIATDSQYASVNGSTITFTYPKGLTSPQTVHIILTDGEIYGSSNTVTYSLSVSIIDHPEVTGVMVSGYSVSVSFDMAMNISTVQIIVSDIDGNITWNSEGTMATFHSNTAVSGNYTLTVPESAESTAGISMLDAYTTTVTFQYTDDDTDGDGMSDSWEAENGLDPNDGSDGAQDADGDGLNNTAEYEEGTDPNNPDTDGDGLPDQWEVDEGTNPTSDDADADNDNDGLTNIQEYQEGTDPQSSDTDSDGMPDIWEVNNGTDPTVNDADADDDNDGLTNLQEYQAGTDPQNKDTDGDGIIDGQDSNPLAPASFVEKNMLLLGILALLIIVGIVALLMKKKKGGAESMPAEQAVYGEQEGQMFPSESGEPGYETQEEMVPDEEMPPANQEESVDTGEDTNQEF